MNMRALLRPVRRLWPRKVRTRLTLIYALLFFAAGSALLGVTYGLVASSLPAQPSAAPVAAATVSKQELTYLSHECHPNDALKGKRPIPNSVRAACNQLKAAYSAGAVSGSQAQRQRALADLLEFSLAGLCVMTAASGGLGWVMSGRVLRPVRVITETARRASEQHLGERLALTGAQDELKELADTFDDMLRTGSSNAAVYLEIANSGPFIPDDAVLSLFEPFRRMEARTGVRDGAGLGLSIARSVLTAHRAIVTARSQPAGGLNITAVIPRDLAAGMHP